MNCPPPCIHPQHLIGALQIRRIASGRPQPISRHTLTAWRTGDFPEPVAVLEGAGPGGNPVELWDARAVTAWLRERKTT